MRHYFRPTIIAILAGWMVLMGQLVGQGAAAKTLKVVFPTGLAEQFSYEFSVIKLALAHSGKDISLKIVEMDGLTGARLFEMVKAGESDLIFGGYSPERNDQLLKVDIPISRGMLGHRVFVTHRENLAALRHVKTVEDLKRFCIGSASDWPDADIMEQNGFCVDRAPRNQLWSMLSNKRFPLLTRAIHEAYREMPTYKELDPNLVLVPDISLVYRYDTFLYVNKDNTALHNVLTKGLERAYASGDFMKNFKSDPSMARALAAMENLSKEFTINNPILDDVTQNIDARYWQNRVEEEPQDPRSSCPEGQSNCPPEEGFNRPPAGEESKDTAGWDTSVAMKTPIRTIPPSH